VGLVGGWGGFGGLVGGAGGGLPAKKGRVLGENQENRGGYLKKDPLPGKRDPSTLSLK